MGRIGKFISRNSWYITTSFDTMLDTGTLLQVLIQCMNTRIFQWLHEKHSVPVGIA